MKRMVYCAFVILFVTACSLILSCCGYSTRSLLPSYFQDVHVKLFQNQTFKVGLDELATNSTIDALRKSTSLRIVDEKSADIVIEGKVTGFSRDPYTYTGDQTVLEYRATVTFAVRCVDKVKNEVFWEGNVSDWASFTSLDQEERAINEATQKTAERLVNTLLTNW